MATTKKKVYAALAVFDALCFIVLIIGMIVHFSGRSIDTESDQVSGPVPDSVTFTESDFEEAEEVVFE